MPLLHRRSSVFECHYVNTRYWMRLGALLAEDVKQWQWYAFIWVSIAMALQVSITVMNWNEI